MTEKKKKHGFRHSLTFKLLCGLVVLFLLGMLYNWIVNDDDTVADEQEQVEEQKRKASLDTLDIVGDYLWPRMKPSKEDMMTDEEKAKAAEAAKKGSSDKAEEDAAAVRAVKIPDAAPVDEVAPASVPSAGPAPEAAPVPSVEKISAPRVESIEQ
ncbi:hypothetical protein [Prevotella dentasini]|uniref:hypothetical protein n=1 Tax=Prevotella dentasini TaxID=589537 RepID=UPI0004699C95|nr:hypothetical protein [Prevotella dentasini]